MLKKYKLKYANIRDIRKRFSVEIIAASEDDVKLLWNVYANAILGGKRLPYSLEESGRPVKVRKEKVC